MQNVESNLVPQKWEKYLGLLCLSLLERFARLLSKGKVQWTWCMEPALAGGVGLRYL